MGLQRNYGRAPEHHGWVYAEACLPSAEVEIEGQALLPLCSFFHLCNRVCLFCLYTTKLCVVAYVLY